MLRRRVGLGAGLLAVLTLAGPDPAPAAPAPPPPAPLYGVRAGLSGSTSLPGGHFTYGLTAGTGVRDSVVVANYSDRPLTLSLYAADVRGADGGGLAPAQADEPMVGVGAWLRLERSRLAIAPKAEATSPFVLTVPPGTPPGDYVGAVVVALDYAPAADGVSLQTRVARLVRLRVPGVARLGVVVARPAARRRGDGQDFTVVVRNTGNVLFRVSGAMAVRRGDDLVASPALSPPDIYVVPGGRATLRARWEGLPTVGRRRARAELRVIVGEGAPSPHVGPYLGLGFFPRAAAAVAATVALLAAAGAVATRKRRSARRRRRRAERAVLAEVRARLRAEGVDRGPAGPEA